MNSIQGLAIEAIRSIPHKGAHIDSEKVWKFKQKCEGAGDLRSIITLAQAMIGVGSNNLDSDPLLFNCTNGTVDLRTGTLRRHQQEDLLTRVSPIIYDAAAKCPRWERFLAEVFRDDRELITFMQRAFGCALTGRPEKALFILVGDGNNGKTTMLEAFRYIVKPYAELIDINVLMQDARNSEQLYAVAKLEGARFVTSSETKESQNLDEAKVKQLTGMGRQSARHIYGHPFSFVPQFKIFIDANHEPQVRGVDSAIWSRLKFVPFPQTFYDLPKDGEPRVEGRLYKDYGLMAKLAEEAPGILAWAVQGCLEWQKHGLNEPQAMKKHHEEYRTESDAISDFLTDECVVGEGGEVGSSALYKRYSKWSRQRGEKPLATNSLAGRLKKHGLKQFRRAGWRGWTGLHLRPE
jgi:putative DNA primase/helicase